jgi:hypothetical protein
MSSLSGFLIADNYNANINTNAAAARFQLSIFNFFATNMSSLTGFLFAIALSVAFSLLCFCIFFSISLQNLAI